MAAPSAPRGPPLRLAARRPGFPRVLIAARRGSRRPRSPRRRFGRSARPDVENASNLTVTTADVEGTVDPKGQSTNWHFEYITEAGYAENLQNSYPGFLVALSGASGSTSVAKTVTGQLTGLQANTTYHLRLLAENTDGQSEAVAASTFTTAPAAPLVTTYAPEPIGAETASLDGVVDPRNAPTTYWFEWGTEDCEVSSAIRPLLLPPASTRSSRSTSPPTKMGRGMESQLRRPDHARLPGEPDRSGGSGSARRALDDRTGQRFGHRCVGLLGISHHLHRRPREHQCQTGDCGQRGQPAPRQHRLEYRPPGGYRTSPKHVIHSLTDLQPETIYHFRLVAENPSGTIETPDREFTTATDAEPDCPNQGMPGTNSLPDCRAYELVSPPSGQNGADVQAESQLPTPPSLETASLTSPAPASATSGARRLPPNTSLVALALSGTNGWSSHNVSPFVTAPDVIAIVNGNLPGFEAFTPDLTGAIYDSWSTLVGHPDPKVSEVTNLYRLDDLDRRTPRPSS